MFCEYVKCFSCFRVNLLGFLRFGICSGDVYGIGKGGRLVGGGGLFLV